MAYFDSNEYRETIRKRLDESDSMEIGGVHLHKEAEKPTYATDTLAKLREKLFGTESVAGMEDSGDAVGPETHDGAAVGPEGKMGEDTYQDQPEEGGEIEAPEMTGTEQEPELTAEDLGDMATDTIMDILGSIKELRDKVKKEDPKKAALIRRVYDHLLKGKEKITAEILKSHEEEKNGGPAEEVKREGKW